MRRWISALVVGAALCAAIAVVPVAAGRSAAAPLQAAAAAPARLEPTGPIVVVRPGDTVWDLALAHLPAGQEPSAYVRQVLAHNDVRAGDLRPGSVLRLPR